MNPRERFLRVMRFEDVDRLPSYEFGYWNETIDRWHAQGLPLELKSNRDIELHFGLEGWDCGEWLPVVTGMWPAIPEKTVSETEDTATVYDGIGGIYIRKRWTSSIPLYLRHPIRDREDWDRLRPFFDPDTPGRFPLDWDEVVETYEKRDFPLAISVGSLYGWLRNWMGVRGLSLAFYKDPDWVADMMDALTNLWLRLIPRALRGVKVDLATWWEDMCYNRGPLLSVELFEEFMVPRYKKVTDLLKDYGVNVNVLDCDGRITELVPGWLEAGINCMFPLEAAHTDIFELRRRHGRDLLLIGGVDKLALMGSKKEIDKELERLGPMMDQGGFIPTVDHRVPPEVTLDNYRYYIERKKEAIVRRR